MPNPDSETDVAGIEKRVQLLEHKISQTPPTKKVRLNSTSEGPYNGKADVRNTRHCPHEGDSEFGAHGPARSSFQNPVETEDDQGSYILQNTKGAMRFFGSSFSMHSIAAAGKHD